MKRELANIKVKFKSYYKYSFCFTNDEEYEVFVGGTGDEIYRCSIEADKEYSIQEVFDECGGSLYIYHNGELVDSEVW